MEYPKIETLFERDAHFVVNPLSLRSPVLGTISEWDVTEKIDGTNIRIMLSVTGEVTFGGRTNNASIPADLVQYLIKTFAPDKIKTLWRDEPIDIVLYGEGYGAGIQKGGGLYRPDKSFILFDVLFGGKWWADYKAVADIATKLDVDVVPYLGRMTLGEIVELVQNGFASRIGNTQSEGIVARPIETLFNKRGNRIIIKLKTKDFVQGKR